MLVSTVGVKPSRVVVYTCEQTQQTKGTLWLLEKGLNDVGLGFNTAQDVQDTIEMLEQLKKMMEES